MGNPETSTSPWIGEVTESKELLSVANVGRFAF